MEDVSGDMELIPHLKMNFLIQFFLIIIEIQVVQAEDKVGHIMFFGNMNIFQNNIDIFLPQPQEDINRLNIVLYLKNGMKKKKIYIMLVVVQLKAKEIMAQ